MVQFQQNGSKSNLEYFTCKLFIIFNSQTMPCLGNFFLILLVMHFSISTSLNINMVTASNISISMYANGQYNSLFVSQADQFNCSMNKLFNYTQTTPQHISNTPYILQFTNVSASINLTLQTHFHNFAPSLASNTCINPTSTTCSVLIYNNCPSDIGQFNYFDILELQVQGLPLPFEFYVLCDDQFSTNTFQWGLVILMVFSLCLIIVVVFNSRAWSMGGAGIKLNYWIIIGFWLAVAISGVIAQTAPNAIFPILQTGSLLLGVIGIWVCSNQTIFLFKLGFLEYGFMIRDIFKIRVLDIISLVIGVGAAVGYYYSRKNWILNDIICISIIIAVIKIMKFTDLKVSIFALCFGLAVEMTFVEIIHYTKGTSYNDLILNDYNYPFELQLPTINSVYKQKCAWLPFTAIIYPGIFMSYLRRFDISRNTNIYFITAVSVFVFGSVIWMLISVGSVHSWPFEIVTGPTMISLVAVFAYKRRQIRTLWQGSFYDQDFANRDGLQDIMNVVNEQSPGRNHEQIQLGRGSIINKLKIDRREDSDFSMIHKLSNYASHPKQEISLSKSSIKS